jgi:hypothetical protein
MDWIYLARDKDCWEGALVNTVMNRRVLEYVSD